ncbi:NAD+ synthase [Desulfovibrio ferrophilus]|uniref:Glutamine-dependent NAD(+) synthetase n=1 Tax=Desulfovibrio ferrophilus TaxID=241368 RepID=A0A2Z6AXK3_9BACT|nr:NAD+ synthase [Desulfovibrio ferrophilus]BBD07984.1 NAD+ synthetase [Desulfovibrio ferrophilus]
MIIALLQLNLTVGDLEGNASRIADGVFKAQAMGAELCVTPELALMGYPPRDLLLSPSFINNAQSQLRVLARELANAIPVLVGTATPNTKATGRPLHNSAALLRAGCVEALFHKTLLPTYDVFDEDRYFEPGPGPGGFELRGQNCAVTICEDLWNDNEFWNETRYSGDPMSSDVVRNSDLVLNLSASPFTVGKQRIRQEMLAWAAKKHGKPICYANQVGGNDDLVFSGRSMAFGADGTLMAQANAFAQDILLVDMQAGTGRIEAQDNAPESETWGALVLGTRDYVTKCGFKKALLGLSGGIDSALTAAVAAEALGASNVLGVLMPSPYSSQGSIDDSLALADNLDIKTMTLPIGPLMQGFDTTLEKAFKGFSPDLTEENIQARIRGNLLMALSNKYGSILLTTGNKSELAVGYCTIYGDMSGGLAVISDVPKTLVYDVCRWLNQNKGHEVIPQSVIDKAPSAELRPDQKDQDSLPPYEILDAIIHRLVVLRESRDDVVNAGFDRTTVDKISHLLRGAEFKRRQAAPGLKITDRAFGTGWRMPLAARVNH